MRTSRSDQEVDGFNLHAWQFDGETGTLNPAYLRTGGVTNMIYNRRWCQRDQLFLHAHAEPMEHGGPT